MKPFQNLLLVLLIISCSVTNKRVYLNEKGKQITSEEFYQMWGNPENQLARWDFKEDTARVATLSHPVYQRLEISYSSFTHNLEKITGKNIPGNTILLLEYTFLNDLCSSKSTNNWNKSVISSWKEFLDPVKDDLKLNNPQILFLRFFEEGISLQNDPASPEEIFLQRSKKFPQKNPF